MTAILPAGVRLAVTGPDLTPVRVVAGEWSRTCNLLADSFLGRLPETLVDQLGVFARVGSPISGPSQPDARVTMLLHGMSKIVRHGTGGGTFLIDLAGPGDLLEPHAVFEPPIAATFYRFTPEAVVLHAARASFERWLRHPLSRYPDAFSHLTAVMSRESRRRIERCATNDLPTPERIYTLLVEWANRHGQPITGERAGVCLENLSQSDVAAALGVSTGSVERALRELRDHDLVQTAYRQFTVYHQT